jgi:hypothetical protein
VRLAALVLAALALTACETNQERSAKLEKAAKQRERAAVARRTLAERVLTITRQSTKVKVTATAVLSSSEGAAAVVSLQNVSNSSLRDVPIQIHVLDSRGASVYTNDTPGLAPALVSAPLLPAHGTLTWIDDQVQSSGGAPASVSVKVGEGTPAAGAAPRLDVEGAHQYEDPTSGPAAEGSIVNHSSVTQRELVVYAVARRAGRIVAAGRAVLPFANAGASTRFQIFFIGDPRSGSLEVSAPATTLG